MIANSSVASVSSLFNDGFNDKFTVALTGIDLVKLGIGVGDAVFYNGPNGEVQGTVASLEPTLFTVAFLAGQDKAPDESNPSFRIVGPGTIQSQMTSFLDGLKQRLSIFGSTPTLQQMVTEHGEPPRPGCQCP